MQRRLFAAVAAFLIAAVGAVLLVTYAQSADARAQAGEDLVPVLVVGTTVPAGTDAADIAAHVHVEQVPTRLAAPGSMADLADVSGQVTTAELLPGEQLLAERFVDPASLLPEGTVAAPAGTQEISLTLQPQQAVNGAVKAGDLVGVLVIGEDQAGNPATLGIDGITVTRSTGGSDGTEATDPNAQITVTLALDATQAATVVAGMQQGTVWLSLQEAGGAGSTTDSASSATPSAGAQA